MKVKTTNNVPDETSKATRKFTDRKEPCEAFWKKYNTVKAELESESSVNVLYYHGIGGIGKSRLLKQLINELESKVHAPRYAYLDLENVQGTDRRAVLTSLKNILAEKYGFVFPFFDMACFYYAQRIGEKVDPVEIKTFIDRNPVLNATLKLADVFVPFLGAGIKLAEIADDMRARIDAFIKGRDKDVQKIKYKYDANMLFEKLPVFFANDLTKNLREKKLSEPLVVFFDTYEVMTNVSDEKHNWLKDDKWIHGDDGIIQNIPNTLWVMAGRGHLNWEGFDEGSGKALDSVSLENFSLEDSVSFLKGAGVEDENLCNQLYYLTNGTPVYLDLCVDNYVRLKERGIIPEISMFGNNTNELVALFMRYFDNTQKDLIYFLACLQKWNDDIYEEIVHDVLGSFNDTSYEEAKYYSFVLQTDDGDYNMHQTVREVLVMNCPATLKNRAGKCIIKKFESDLQKLRPFDDGFVAALTYIAQAILLIYKEREDICEMYNKYIREKLSELAETGHFERAERVLDIFFEIKIKDDKDKLYATMKNDMGHLCMLKGDYETALLCTQDGYEVLKAISGGDDIDTLRAKRVYARDLYNLGKSKCSSERITKIKHAQKMQEEVLSKYNILLGEKNHETLKVKRNLVDTLEQLGEEPQKRLEYAEFVYNGFIDSVGEDHIDTIKAMETFAKALKDNKQAESAFDIRCNAYEICKNKFGEDHPQTLRAQGNLSVMMPCDKKRREMQETIYKKQCERLGGSHPDTIETGEHLQKTLYQLDRTEEALELYKQYLSED